MNSDLRVDIAAALAAIDRLRPCLDTLERTHTPAADIRVRVRLSSEIRNLDALYNATMTYKRGSKTYRKDRQ